MPFQIRRGTEAERVSITPAVAEPIFTTDTKRLYVGDGTTLGGIRVSGAIPDSIRDLSDVSLPPSPNSGDVLTWNGSTFTASPIPPAIVDGSDYNINIVADDSTKLVDITTKQFNGNLVGDVTGNLSGNVTGFFSGDAVIQTLQINGNVVGDGDAVVFDQLTSTFFTNLNGNVTGQLFGEHFGDVTAMTIRLDDGVIINSDSSVLLDARTNTLYANVVGDVTGNVNGNVTGQLFGEHFGDVTAMTIRLDDGVIINSDSSVLLDARTNTLYANVVGDVTGNLSGNVTGQLFGEHFGDVTAMTIRLDDGVIINSDSSVLLDASTNTLYANVVGDVTGNVNGNVTGSFTGNASIDILQLNDQLIINGDIVGDDSSVILERNTRTFFANLNGDVVGSVFMDDSTKIIDGITGSVSANGFVQFGSYTSSERPAGVNGMVIYNSTANRFQGFQNGAWINIDDGSAA